MIAPLLELKRLSVSFSTDDGTVRHGVPLLDVPWLRFGNDPHANLELAAVWARIHGHPEVESFLVQRGVNATARNNWGKLAV